MLKIKRQEVCKRCGIEVNIFTAPHFKCTQCGGCTEGQYYYAVRKPEAKWWWFPWNKYDWIPYNPFRDDLRHLHGG